MYVSKCYLVIFALAFLIPTSSLADTDVLFCSATGHYYQRIDVSHNWDVAKSEAESLVFRGASGHLATITSQEEQDFIATNVMPSAPWPEVRYWLGGYQPSGSAEPGGNWSWITGEPWSYTHWAPGEPNNAGAEDCLEIHHYGDLQVGVWNDRRGSLPDVANGYIVEYEPPLFAASDFADPMGKKKKLGSTLPVKFQLFVGDDEMQSPEEIGQALGLSEPVSPRILVYDVSTEAQEVGLELPVDDNVGEGGDLGDCFRYADGSWIFNLRISSPSFASAGTYVVNVEVGDMVLEPGNNVFQVK
jgi:hypothetical protein